MKQLFYFCFLALFFRLSPLVFAQENKEEQAAAQQKWMDYMTPSNTHKMMAKNVGEWTTTMEMWQAPNSVPTKSVGTCKSEMILGGRYMQSKYSGNVMGMPFEGISTDGYDNAKNVYINTWIDNMGTGIMHAEGKYDNGTKTITYVGTMFDPMQNTDVPYRQTMQMVDDNHMIMEMFNIDKNSKEYKSLHVDYVRK
ncbi:MAG: DUF1579 domain-containing protein [Ignavibacteriaceae bacterium]|nr:DUF1579 domain-containing protein [Ignavibacteriaceae bacterium]